MAGADESSRSRFEDLEELVRSPGWRAIAAMIAERRARHAAALRTPSSTPDLAAVRELQARIGEDDWLLRLPEAEIERLRELLAAAKRAE